MNLPSTVRDRSNTYSKVRTLLFGSGSEKVHKKAAKPVLLPLPDTRAVEPIGKKWADVHNMYFAWETANKCLHRVLNSLRNKFEKFVTSTKYLIPGCLQIHMESVQ